MLQLTLEELVFLKKHLENELSYAKDMNEKRLINHYTKRINDVEKEISTL